MNEELAMLRHAIRDYDLDPAALRIESRLPGIYHSDYHYKIRVEDRCYSARFISNRRYEHDVFVALTDQVLEEQMNYIQFLNGRGIPFMRLQAPSFSKSFAKVSWNGAEYRFLLFEWIEGKHITHCTESVSYQFGQMARKLHDVSIAYPSSLPKDSHRIGSMKMMGILEDAYASSDLSAANRSLLHDYILLAKWHIGSAYSSKLEFMMQSDLNPLNVLWDEEEHIVGIVDFEHIGYTDRIEGLAWLIKWYSRTKGLESHEVSPALAESLLSGYGARDFLGRDERIRLSSLIWLTGCFNWGFVHKTKKILESKEHDRLAEHLAKFRERGLKLSALITV
ncbi:phosphotransferase enzyme family protein [Paenibacillus spongiae]|uniref:Phosphotransferase n=1 Tax=Paenibacillus spongiae TaxID=2909671 RepID=A0ABY5S636_9BACL|nr:phosphotransferase [Paenibacillus spongiae]UVI29371.1 phosphotransferase [Paenibacillus spongiae]